MNSHRQLPSTDELLHLLSRERRRRVLRYLAGSDGERVPLEDVAGHLARSDVGPTTARECLVDLHHMHLPRLAEASLVEYDHDTRTVAYIANPEVEALLTVVDRHLE